MAADTGTGTPESVDIREAAALMTDAEVDETPEQDAAAHSQEAPEQETETVEPESEPGELRGRS